MRALSYNIHKGIGGRDRRYSLDRIISVIEAENPDLICLQEVDRAVPRSSFDDQPKILAEYFKAVAQQFQPNVTLKTGVYGNLMLSRWPFVAKHHISLRLNRKKSRGAQMAVIDTPEGQLHLTNFHLGLAEAERHWQIQHLLTHQLYKESVAHFGRFQRLAEHPLHKTIGRTRLCLGDDADFQISLVSGLLADWIARQGFCPRRYSRPSGTRCAFPHGTQGIGSFAAGDRFSSGENYLTFVYYLVDSTEN